LKLVNKKTISEARQKRPSLQLGGCPRIAIFSKIEECLKKISQASGFSKQQQYLFKDGMPN
jgi:hypothetical protein